MKLELKDISKEYGKKKAVNHLSLTFEEGVYGLLGANGAGKTTLMNIMCGVLKATTGDVRFEGKNILDDLESYCSYLGFLPQGFGYYPEFSALDFMTYMGLLKGLNKKDSIKRSQELLKMVGLGDVQTKAIRSFSGGMKQRLGIAQALINNPKILILDEPTVGLDPKERIRFRSIIADLSKDRIVIISTHIVSDVELIANRIIMMKQGDVVVQGSVEEIVKTIDHKVWDVCVGMKDVEPLVQKYCISNQKYEGKEAIIRVISEEKPMEAAVVSKPTLEDLYIYTFKDQDIHLEEV